ncbi:MAG TPA: DNA-3-methyladenine glycosylase [Longimicrobiales bacterium]
MRSPRADALAASWYERPAEAVARDLLGAVLVSTIDGVVTAGRIVETEAYIGPHDDASHAAERIGRTERNEAMYGRPGIAYIYRIYGIHWCLNVVTDRVDYPAAVLIRAIEPVRGIEHMRARRSGVQKRLPDVSLTNGPGKLAGALGITGQQNAHSLDRDPLLILPGDRVADDEIECGPRIGITRAADWPLRFWMRSSAWISR